MTLMRRRTRIALSFAAASLPMLGIAFAGGCSSSTLPPELTSAELAAVHGAHIKATVRMEPFRYPVYSENLARDLRATGVFDAVEPSEASNQSTVVASVERPVYGTATIPIMTILTLGIVPTTVEEDYGYVFSVSSPADRQHKVVIDCTYRGTTTLGWWAALLNLSSNRTGQDRVQTERYRNQLAASIIARREDILSLAGQH